MLRSVTDAMAHKFYVVHALHYTSSLGTAITIVVRGPARLSIKILLFLQLLWSTGYKQCQVTHYLLCIEWTLLALSMRARPGGAALDGVPGYKRRIPLDIFASDHQKSFVVDVTQYSLFSRYLTSNQRLFIPLVLQIQRPWEWEVFLVSTKTMLRIWDYLLDRNLLGEQRHVMAPSAWGLLLEMCSICYEIQDDAAELIKLVQDPESDDNMRMALEFRMAKKNNVMNVLQNLSNRLKVWMGKDWKIE